MAADQGADAVIDVAYQGSAWTEAGTSMSATGLAVRKLARDVDCPNCGEMIERVATHCRFCGHRVTAPASLEAIRSRAAMFTPTPPLLAIPDLRGSERHRSLSRVGLGLACAIAIIAGLTLSVRLLTR